MVVKLDTEKEIACAKSEVCLKEYAHLIRRGAQEGTYLDKLTYAAFRKRMEGDLDYAKAILDVRDALAEVGEDEDESKNASVLQARRKLNAVREARSPYASFKYHKYMFDSVPHTMKSLHSCMTKEKDGNIILPDFATTEDLYWYIIPSDAVEIGELLGMTADEVLKAKPQDILVKLEALGLPDHPERYVITNLYIPSPQTLKYLGVLDDFVESFVLSGDRQMHYNFLDRMYGKFGERGVYKEALYNRGRELPYWVKQDILRALRHEDFNLGCYGEGGDMETVDKYWAYIKEHPHR